MAYEKIVSVPSTATSGQVPQADGAGGFSWGDITIPESGVQMELLWENASPTSAFAAQSITIDELSNYDVCIVMGVYSSDSSAFYGYCDVSMFSPKHLATEYRLVHGDAFRPYNVTENNINFENVMDGFNNTYIIPHLIYGIKGVTTNV